MNREERLFTDYYETNKKKFFTPSFFYFNAKNNKKIHEGYCLVSNEDEKMNFLKIEFYLEKGYKIDEIELLLGNYFFIPKLYTKFYKLNKEQNFFDEEKILVMEKTYFSSVGFKKEVSNTVNETFLYFIDKDNNRVSEKIQIYEELNNDFFRISRNEICDKNLNIIKFNCDTFLKFIEDVGVICSINKEYTLFNFEGNKILNKLYEDYKVSNDNKSVGFIEYPVFSFTKNDHFVVNQRNKKYRPAYKIYNYINGKLTTEENINYDINSTYFYNSDSNYKYREFYFELDKRKNEISLNFRSLGFNEFIELREKYVQYSLINKGKNYFKYLDEEERKKYNSNSCYIATMVYEDMNHPKVELLRQFRDNVLIKRFFGRVFIKYYYQYSPSLVEKLKNYKKTNYIIKKVLDLVIKIIK